MPDGAVFPEGLARPIAPYSPAVAFGDLVFLSGQIPFDESGALVSEEFAPQARQTFENMRRCLEAAGCGFGDVLKVNAYLASFDDFAAYNEIYAEYFASPHPARTTVQAGLYGFRIEVEAVARVPR